MVVFNVTETWSTAEDRAWAERVVKRVSQKLGTWPEFQETITLRFVEQSMGMQTAVPAAYVTVGAKYKTIPIQQGVGSLLHEIGHVVDPRFLTLADRIEFWKVAKPRPEDYSDFSFERYPGMWVPTRSAEDFSWFSVSSSNPRPHWNNRVGECFASSFARCFVDRRVATPLNVKVTSQTINWVRTRLDIPERA